MYLSGFLVEWLSRCLLELSLASVSAAVAAAAAAADDDDDEAEVTWSDDVIVLGALPIRSSGGKRQDSIRTTGDKGVTPTK